VGLLELCAEEHQQPIGPPPIVIGFLVGCADVLREQVDVDLAGHPRGLAICF